MGMAWIGGDGVDWPGSPELAPTMELVIEDVHWSLRGAWLTRMLRVRWSERADWDGKGRWTINSA